MTLPIDQSAPFAPELATALDAARRASQEIIAIYDARSAGIYEKGDGSPVTDADLAADRVIQQTIMAAFPADALMTEEGENDDVRLANPRVWIVDPIDGTAQFVARTGKFDVLIALVEDGEPKVAVALQPTTGLTHVAIRGGSAWRYAGKQWERFTLSSSANPPRVVGSKYYLEPQFSGALESITSVLGAGPSPTMDVGFQPRALDKSERWYDVFIGFPQDPRIFAAREWDIAASQLIVEEAGGILTDCWGRRHRYNKRDTHISGGLIVSPSTELHQEVLDAVRPHLPAHPPAPDPADDLI